MEEVEKNEKINTLFFNFKRYKCFVHITMVRLCFICVTEERGFVKHNKDICKSGPNGDPIATPSICLYM